MNTIGFVPAAGIGKRMKPFLLIKELLPVKNSVVENGKEGLGLLFENSMESFRKNGISHVVCTISEEKDELRQYMLKYTDANHLMKLAFVYQDTKRDVYGLLHAIKEAAFLLRGKTVVMRFPDTVLEPLDCIKDIMELHVRKGADVTLGVFPTKHPERLAPVIVSDDERVLEVQDKPQNPKANNTWNCVIWEDSFLNEILAYIDEHQEKEGKELVLSDVISGCLAKNMKVYAKVVANGSCSDYSCTSDFMREWKANG